jgi:hypothetical protein
MGPRIPGGDSRDGNSSYYIVVREYASQEAFQNDAVKLKARGYDVLSVNERSQNAGCLRILTLGLLALVVRPKPFGQYFVIFSGG